MQKRFFRRREKIDRGEGDVPQGRLVCLTLGDAEQAIRSYDFGVGKLDELRGADESGKLYDEVVSSLKSPDREAWQMFEEVRAATAERMGARGRPEANQGARNLSLPDTAARWTREVMELWALYQAVLKKGNKEFLAEWINGLSAFESIVLGHLVKNSKNGGLP